MIAKNKIEELAHNFLKEKSIYLVDVTISGDNDIEVAIENDIADIDIKDCVEVSRAIEGGLNREEEDFSLTVTSAGLDQPFKVLRQYKKFMGKEVEIILRSGIKIVATLTETKEDGIEICYSKLEKIEGKKRRERVEKREFINFADIKTTKPFINFR